MRQSFLFMREKLLAELRSYRSSASPPPPTHTHHSLFENPINLTHPSTHLSVQLCPPPPPTSSFCVLSLSLSQFSFLFFLIFLSLIFHLLFVFTCCIVDQCAGYVHPPLSDQIVIYSCQSTGLTCFVCVMNLFCVSTMSVKL